MGGRDFPDLLQYYIGGFLQSLLEYYRFGRNMEGLKSFSVLHMFNVVVKVCILSQIWKNMRICVFKGVNPDYYNITWRGSSQFITTLHRGEGSTGAPYLYCVIKALGKLLPRLIKPHRSPPPELDLS